MPVLPSRRRKAYPSIIVAVALLATPLLPGTAAAEVKPYSVVLTPSSVQAGQRGGRQRHDREPLRRAGARLGRT